MGKIKHLNKSTKAGGFYLFGNFFNKGIAFITVPIFTRLLTTSDFGLINTYLSWVSILSVIIGLQLGNSIRHAYVDYIDSIDEYISSITLLSLINFIFSFISIVGVAYFFRDKIDIFLVILCVIQSYMTFISNMMNIKYMMGLQYVRNTLLLSIPNILISILSIILILNMEENKYLGRILPYVIVTSIIGVSYIIVIFIRGKNVVNSKYWRDALFVSVPLIFHGLSINILSQSDRTLLTIFKGTSETGIYSLIYNFSMITTVFASSLENVWIPWFTDNLRQGKKEIINDNVKLYIEIMTVLTAGILMVAPEILKILAPKEYWGGTSLIPPLVLSSFVIFLYSISVNIEYFYKSTKGIASNTIIAAAINIILNILFIPLFGAMGAAYVTLLAYCISLFLHINKARKLDNKLIPYKVYISPSISISLVTVLYYNTMDEVVLRWFLTTFFAVIYIINVLHKERFKNFLR